MNEAFSIRRDEWKARVGDEVLPHIWNSKGAALAGIEVELRRRAAKSAPFHIVASQITWTGEYRGCADASDLGLAPGVWPTIMTTDCGNGEPLLFEREYVEGKERRVMIYAQRSGFIEVAVFND